MYTKPSCYCEEHEISPCPRPDLCERENQRRLDRIELLLRAMHDDCAVHGVLWSRETEAMLAEIALARRSPEVADATA